MTLPRALLPALVVALSGTGGLTPPARLTAADPPQPAGGNVSYYKDVRPLFAQHCNGCHQPAKPQGGYVMTAYADLLKAGEREKPGVVPGKPKDSYLLDQIALHDGKAEMPKGRDPLTAVQVKLVADWIAQGAADDTPAAAKEVAVDAAHPPRYAAPPVVTAAAFDPSGEYLAVAGYHEVLLYSAKDYRLVSRLVGISERINAVAFNPAGTRLAAVGGSPGRFGEVQVWDHKRAKLLVSAPVTFDALYGASWSPDGTVLAFGCGDNTVRAVDPATGKQVLQMGTHADWVLGTVFSQDGQHLASVSRDMSMKLTEVTTQRFVDNVTSITPGALKGGLMAVDRRPVDTTPKTVRVFGLPVKLEKVKRMQKVPPDALGLPAKLYDELLVGGSDGTPRRYKMHREQVRQIGDDANRVMVYDPMPGRLSAVAFSPDGKRFAAASSLDGTGQVRVYDTETGKHVVCEQVPGPAYTVGWHPAGKLVVSAGFDGTVRLHDATTGKLVKAFPVMPATGVAAK